MFYNDLVEPYPTNVMYYIYPNKEVASKSHSNFGRHLIVT